MDLGSPKQLRWAKEGSQGLLVASYLAGDGRMGAFVGGAERPPCAAVTLGASSATVTSHASVAALREMDACFAPRHRCVHMGEVTRP